MTRTEKDKIKAWVARNGRVRKYHEEVLNKGNIEIVEKSEELTDEEILALIKYNKKQSRKYVQPKKGGRFFMADFETTTQEAMERTGADHTEVWAWAICPIPCNYEQRDVVIGNSLDSFMEWCKKNLHEDDIVFFHNLTFDGSFIMSWLLNHGYKQEKCGWKNKKHFRNYDLLAGSMAGFYSLTIGMGKGAFRFQDSAKLLAFTVYEIGESFQTRVRKSLIDYDAHDKAGEFITPEEEEYIANDVLVVAQALYDTLLSRGYTKMTAGSNALHDFIERFGGKGKFREKFPVLEGVVSRKKPGETPEEERKRLDYEDSFEDNFTRKSYRGAVCMTKEGIEGQTLRGITGITVDKHSMYPSQMHSKGKNYYPVGTGTWTDMGITGNMRPLKQIETILDTIENNYGKKVSFLSFMVDFSVKPDHAPFVQLKNFSRFAPNEFIKESNGMVRMYMSDAEFKLFTEQYNINAFQFLKAIEYKAEIGLFDEFIDYWYGIKESSKGALKQLAKLMLNSLYGKFATSLEGDSMEAHLGYTDKRGKYHDDGIVHYTHIAEERKGVYIPVGAMVTAYARCDLVRAIQANFDNFLYCDTDSLHLKGLPRGIPITKKDICTWGVEGTFNRAKYIRQKTYFEVDNRGGRTVRCAGLPRSVVKEVDGKIVRVGARELVNFDNFDVHYDFASPDSPFRGCKLRRQTIKGGVILVPTDFQIRG